jgi:HEAT repeat protein
MRKCIFLAVILLLPSCSAASYQGRSVDDWLAQLYVGTQEERHEASIALGKIGRPAVPGLRAALKDGDACVRRTAAEALSRMYQDAADALPDLHSLLRDSDPTVQAAAARAIGHTGDLGVVAVPDLANLLHSADPLCRLEAVDALGRIGAEAAPAAPAMCSLLQDPDLKIRRLAAQQLGRTRAPAAIPSLLAALHDDDREVRLNAGFSLRRIDPAVAAQHGYW